MTDPWGYPTPPQPPQGRPDQWGRPPSSAAPPGQPDPWGRPPAGGSMSGDPTILFPPPPPPVAPRGPALTLTVVITLLAGLFGAIPASIQASRARALGLDGSRYWKAFGVALGAQVTVVVLVVALGVGFLRGGLIERMLGDPTTAEPEGTQAPAGVPGPVAPAPTTTTASEPVPSPTRPERTGRERPARDPDIVTVQAGSGGSACEATSTRSDWGAYPVAGCRTWKNSTGLLSGSSLSVGPIVVTCQADLQEQNPVYTAKQTNTWWFWARSDNGTWDWFPETALAQGASDQPVNGIALCR